MSNIRQHYDRLNNANLFISNNANPFLISPYAPNKGTTSTGTISTDTLNPYTPSSTIQVNAPLQVNDAFYVTIGGTNKFKVTSTEAVFNTPIVRLNALDMVTTPLPPATPVTLQGYAPLSVNGVPYYVPFYS
jgi:hypothetical protein